MAETYVLTDVLDGGVDAEARARETPNTFWVKGMYFRGHRDRVGWHWTEVEPTLQAPPRNGKYVHFRNYPQADFTRLVAAAARYCYPSQPLREGIRRVARDDFEVFTESTLGRITLSMVGDPRRALLKMASVYTKMASDGDWAVRGFDTEDGQVAMEYQGLYGIWEYQLGQVEGLIRFYKRSPRVTVHLLGVRHVRFDVAFV